MAGAFAAPITAATALAPFGGAALADVIGSHGGALTALACLVALGALLVALAYPVHCSIGPGPAVGNGRRPRS